MTTGKKLIITIAVVSVAIVLAITALIVVLVSTRNNAQSAISIKYNASDNVSVDLSARYLLGDSWTQMLTGNGEAILSLTPKTKTGSLSPVTNKIKLDSDNYIIAFEYKFLSKMSDIGASISLTSEPATKENVKVTYSYSNTKLNSLDEINKQLQNTSYTTQALGYNIARYVYIVVQIDNLLDAGKLAGDFVWSLNRADIVKLTYNIPLGSTADNYEWVVKNTSYNNLNVFPYVTNKMFLGWGTSSSATTPIAFPRTFSSNTTYYPIYVNGGISTSTTTSTDTNLSSYITYNTSLSAYVVDFDQTVFAELVDTVVIPDLYNDGVNGVAPIVKALGNYFDPIGDYSYDAYIGTFRNVGNLYIGNFVQDVMGLIGHTVYYFSPGLMNNLYIGTGLTNIPYNEEHTHSYIISTEALQTISVVPGNPTYDSRNNCNAIIERATDTLILGSQSTTFADSVKHIGKSAFTSYYGNTTLTSISIPSTIQTIGDYAFYNCKNLTSLTIPSSITSIGDGAFSYTNKLTSINFNCTDLSNLKVENEVFNYSGANGNGITVNIGATVTRIPNYIFSPHASNSSSPKITSVVFASNSNCKTIGVSAFAYCKDLANITIPSSVTTIKTWAFLYCTSLSSITIPSTVRALDSGVFEYCTSLTNVTISEGVPLVGSYMFSACFKLSSIVLPASVTSIGNNAFSWCDSLIIVVLNEGLQTIGDNAFKGCNNTALTDITIPATVTWIGKNAFTDCTGLQSVIFADDNSIWFVSQDSSFSGTPIQLAPWQDEIAAVQYVVLTYTDYYFKKSFGTGV